MLRLLKLPDEVRAEVASGRLSMGHARAIVVARRRRRSAPHRARGPLARALGARDRSDRQAGLARPAATAPKRHGRTRRTCTRARPKNSCASRSGTAVEIKRRGKGGVVEIAFANEDELQRIYEYLTERLIAASRPTGTN